MEYLLFVSSLIWFYFSWRDLKQMVLLLPLFLPVYLVKFDFFVPVNLLEIFILITFGVFVLKNGFRGIKESALPNWIFPVALFLFAATASVFIVPDSVVLPDGAVINLKKAALGIWKGWIFIPILYFVMLTQIKKSETEYKYLMNSWIVSGVFLSLFSLYQVWTGNYLTEDQRASGVFVSANYLALYLAPIFLYVLLQVVFTQHRSVAEKLTQFVKNILKPHLVEREKIFLWIILIILGLALFFTKSYAAWIAIFAGYMFYYFLKDKGVTLEKLIGAMAILVLFFGIFATQINSEKFQSWFDFNSRSSSSVRLEVWEISLNFIKQSPVFGIGLGNFSYKYQLEAAQILNQAPKEWIMLHPHNVFLMFWLSSGIMGLVAFIWILINCFRYLKKSLTDKQKNYVVLSLSMLIVMLVHGLFDTSVWKNDLFILFWLVIGSFDVNE